MSTEDVAPPYFDALLHVLAPREGGRRSGVFSGFRPGWFVPQKDGTRTYHDGMITVLGGETITPGKTGLIRIVPLVPEYWQEVEVGSHLVMCEGPHRIGEAIVTKVWRQH